MYIRYFELLMNKRTPMLVYVSDTEEDIKTGCTSDIVITERLMNIIMFIN